MKEDNNMAEERKQAGFDERIALGEVSARSFSELHRVLGGLFPELSYVGEEEPLELTPNKGYTAIGSLSGLASQGDPLGIRTAYLVMFRQGEGTGNQGDYEISGVPAGHTPRRKDGMHAELFLPIGTGFNDTWTPGVTCLEQWTYNVSAEMASREGNLTTDPRAFTGLINVLRQRRRKDFSLPSRVVGGPKFTLDRETKGSYGDPHAIVWPDFLEPADDEVLFQVGAFLAFPEPSKELSELRKKLRVR